LSQNRGSDPGIEAIGMRYPFQAWLLLGLTIAAVGLWAPQAHADKRVALVIGNGAYRNAPRLPNPPNDAQDVAAALKRTGFDVVLAIDADKVAMDDAEIRFSRVAHGADVAMFYYSGHAMQVNGVNYLMPVDTKLVDEADLRRMERVDDIIADLQQAKNLSILVLDSCRDNPLAEAIRSIGSTRGLSINRGLAPIDSPQGMIVAFSTQKNATAEDGTGRNSPYTTAFLKNIEKPEEITTVFRRIAADVYNATSQRQRPELSLSAIGDFFLNGRSAANGPGPIPGPPPPVPPSDPCAAAGEHWRSAESIGTAEAYQDHLAHFPNCAFAGLARAKLAALQQRPPIPPPTPPSTAVATGFLFPDSDRRYLSRAELSSLPTAQLRIARNEIYARKGRYFRDQELAAYFGRMAWYKPFAWDVSLTAVEQANVKLIQSMEH
jgi:hypothetical protein